MRSPTYETNRKFTIQDAAPCPSSPDSPIPAVYTGEMNDGEEKRPT